MRYGRGLLCFLALWFPFCVLWADGLPSFDLQRMPLSQIVSLYFKEVYASPYVLCDELLNDQRLVSLRADGKQLDEAILRGLLVLNGYEVKRQGLVTLVQLKPAGGVASSIIPSDHHPFVYRPKFRSVATLVALVSPLVHGVFANQAVSAPAAAVGGSSSESIAASYNASDGEVLVFAGEKKQTLRLEKLLKDLDVPESSVLVRAVLYEVSKSMHTSSALKLVSDLLRRNGALRGNASLSLGRDVLQNSLSIGFKSFDAVASAISADERFKVITSPFLRVKNQHAVRLQVGQDVPVSGKILINPNGQTTQSTEYHSSGVILHVSANIRGQVVDLDVTQTVSNFIKTTTGNVNNPTMNKREVQTSLSLKDKEIVVLGGLLDQKDENGKSGLFGINFAKSVANDQRELLLLLQVEKV